MKRLVTGANRETLLEKLREFPGNEDSPAQQPYRCVCESCLAIYNSATPQTKMSDEAPGFYWWDGFCGICSKPSTKGQGNA